MPPETPSTAASATAQPEYVPAWSVIVPVKAASVGKSRLDGAGADRTALARAIALDTIEAVAAATHVERVIVVTSDDELVREARRIERVSIVADPDAAGLDAAVAAGASAAGVNQPRAALLGDLPALHPAELDAALAAATTVERGLVADAEGTGTTLVTARPGAVWVSAFGDGSAERHRLLGCVDLAVPEGTGLRRDVDTPEQLAEARALGLGSRTTALVSAATAPTRG
jgi:2-phospho-L-lactate/phosphoenolpyruvate guanylyltransferase